MLSPLASLRFFQLRDVTASSLFMGVPSSPPQMSHAALNTHSKPVLPPSIHARDRGNFLALSASAGALLSEAPASPRQPLPVPAPAELEVHQEAVKKLLRHFIICSLDQSSSSSHLSQPLWSWHKNPRQRLKCCLHCPGHEQKAGSGTPAQPVAQLLTASVPC